MTFKNRGIVALVLFSLFSGLSPAGSDDLFPLDQSTGTGSNEYSSVGDNIEQRSGQTITPSITGYLKSVEIFISKDNENVTGELSVGVIPMSTRGVVLEGSQLTAQRIDASLIFTYGSWITVTFEEPAFLKAGKPFMIRLVGDNYGQSNENTYRWHSRTFLQADYTRGRPYFNNLEGWTSGDYDFLIRTYVEAGVGPAVEETLIPKVSVFLKTTVKIPSTLEKIAIIKVAKNLTVGKTLVCTGYTYSTSAAARAYSLKLAKAMCAIAKAAAPRITVVSETKASGKAARAARGSKWQVGSFRVDLSLRNTAD